MPAPTKYLNCKERIERRIVELLEDISVANEFNTDVRKVKRLRGAPREKDKAPEIYAWMPAARPQGDVDGLAAQQIMVGALGIIGSVYNGKDPEKAEIAANYLASDIQRALITRSGDDDGTMQIFVDSGTPAGEPIAVDLALRNISSNAGNEPGLVYVTFVYAVTWRQLTFNDRKFNREDTEIQEAA